MWYVFNHFPQILNSPEELWFSWWFTHIWDHLGCVGGVGLHLYTKLEAQNKQICKQPFAIYREETEPPTGCQTSIPERSHIKSLVISRGGPDDLEWGYHVHSALQITILICMYIYIYVCMRICCLYNTYIHIYIYVVCLS